MYAGVQKALEELAAAVNLCAVGARGACRAAEANSYAQSKELVVSGGAAAARISGQQAPDP
jgi:hypothetical protein